jgi:NitT/TauT family transport system substrate-binding protein
MRRCGAVLAAALLAFAVSAPAASAAALQKIKITVPSVEASDAAYFVAAQRGYFKDEGLDVELVFAGGGTATPALLSGTVDGSASGSAAISAILRGAGLRVVMIFTDSPTYKIWATQDIKTLADLKGKSVGVATRGDTYEIATRLALQAAGVAPDSVGYTPLGFGSGVGAAIESGALPAVTLSTSAAVAMQDDGQLKKAHVVSDFYGKVHMPWNGFAMSEKVLTGDPVMARKIVRAVVKGARYMKVYKNETVGMVAKYQKPAHLHAIGVDYDEFMKALTRDFTTSDELIASDLDVRAAMIGLPKDKMPPADKVYDFSLVRSINAELDAGHWKPIR